MPVVSPTTTLVAFPAARIRRLPARPAPARTTPAPALRGAAVPEVTVASVGATRAAMGAGVGVVLLVVAGLGGWGFVAAERGVQASLAGYVASPVSAAGVGSSGVRVASSSAWDRR